MASEKKCAVAFEDGAKFHRLEPNSTVQCTVEGEIKNTERKLVYEEPEMIQTRSRVLEKRKREEEAKKKAKKGRVVVI